MSRRAPLWAQLVGVWAVAIALAALLLVLDRWFVPSTDFYWLIPYPSGAAGWLRLLWEALRVRPLAVSALAIVPPFAAIATLGFLAAALRRALACRTERRSP